MAIFLLGLIALIALLAWFLRRRRHPGAEKESIERLAESGAVPSANSTAVPRIETQSSDLPARQSLAEIEQQCAGDFESESRDNPAGPDAVGESPSAESCAPCPADNVVPVEGHDNAGVRESSLFNSNAAHVEMARHDDVQTGDAANDGTGVAKPQPEAADLNVVLADDGTQQAKVPIPERGMAGTDEAPMLPEAGMQEEKEKTQRYRPPVHKSPPQRQTDEPRAYREERSNPSEESLGILVRLTFDRFGVLARRFHFVVSLTSCLRPAAVSE